MKIKHIQEISGLLSLCAKTLFMSVYNLSMTLTRLVPGNFWMKNIQFGKNITVPHVNRKTAQAYSIVCVQSIIHLHERMYWRSNRPPPDVVQNRLASMSDKFCQSSRFYPTNLLHKNTTSVPWYRVSKHGQVIQSSIECNPTNIAPPPDRIKENYQ